MPRLKRRPNVKPIPEQDPSALLREHMVKNIDAHNMLVSEYDVVNRQRPLPFWKRDLKIPQWLLLVLVSLTIVLFTGFILFTTVVTLQKQTNGGPCKSNSDCRQDLGLMCNNYRCGCAYSHFWSDTYDICERRRMINRTCVDDSMCDSLANLECENVTLSSGGYQWQCQCQTSMSWSGHSCVYQLTINQSCTLNANCDSSRFLFCDASIGGYCNCNVSMFWNGGTLKSGTCEYKRTVGEYCYPYNHNWCDDTGPIGQGLTCTAYTNPYGSEYGVCQCSTNQYYNGTASLANGYCVNQHRYNESCTLTSQCDYRVNLICSNNLCTCPSGTNYDSTMSINGITGYCTAAEGYMDNCTASLTCSSSQSLYCDFTYYGNVSASGKCLCNSSWSYWDGTTCASKLSIGGECSSNINCISSLGLFCSNYTQSMGTCDCDSSHYWNGTCSLKLWYNVSCTSSYVCDDNRGLQCQGLGGIMFQKCDCYNTSYIWDSLYITRQDKCMLKLGYNQSTCHGNLECQDYNYLVCNGTKCACLYTAYWDGTVCQPKRNYTDPCSFTYQCRDFGPVNLICIMGTTVPPVLQCLCNATSFWDDCQQACVVSKKIYQSCTLTTNCSSNECDKAANLQCLNTSLSSNAGWCNCTSLQWWNGSYCRDKGIPAWGSNSSALCNSSYQCADYNLVSCPLGASWPSRNSTCECATTKYWNGVTCLDRVMNGQPCTLWNTSAVNTSTCLNAAGAGLLCSSNSSCTSGTCTGGTCYCPSDGFTYWSNRRDKEEKNTNIVKVLPYTSFSTFVTINANMKMNKNNILIWLKEFKCNWLPQNVSNDNCLFQLLTNKIDELEQLLIHEKDTSVAERHERANTTTSDINQSFISTEESHEPFVFMTPPNKRIQIDDDDEKKENPSRPKIRIKRITLAEAELYLPTAWILGKGKSKRGRKKDKKTISTIVLNGNKAKRNTQTNKSILSSIPDTDMSANPPTVKRRIGRPRKTLQCPSLSSLTSTQSLNNDKKKSKRKLRAIDAEDDDLITVGNLFRANSLNGEIGCEPISRFMGQNGLLSQTRKTSETMMNNEDDSTFKLQMPQTSNDDIVIPLNPIKNIKNTTESFSFMEILNHIEDQTSINHEPVLNHVIENNDNESLFATINLTRDNTFDSNSTIDKAQNINYSDCIEDISNDGIDPPPPPPPPTTTLSPTNLSHLSVTT
ncbi:unnamed protein product [Rotaria socialis]